MGLELKPSKTSIAHTLQQYQGRIGFDFLGFTVRQFPVGKPHSGSANQYGPPLGFKTIITPSKEAVQRHIAEMRAIIKRNKSASQGKLIRELNAVIRGWTTYYRSMAATRTFSRCQNVLYLQLRSWANRRHPNKNKHWIAQKYWHVDDGNGWIFTDQQGATLWKHSPTHIQRHVKVRATASPYNGDVLYWSRRLQTHPMFNGMLAKLLQRQRGKCKWCGLFFQDADLLEVDHVTAKSQGGGNEISNRCVLHRHCHDQRHAKRVAGTYDRGHIVEELDDAKVSCPVLKPSKGGDSFV